MGRRAPPACLALLWGCALAAASAAQGKEGKCARPDPGPCSVPSPARRDVRHFGNSSPGVLRSGGLAGCEPGESGAPAPAHSGL